MDNDLFGIQQAHIDQERSGLNTQKLREILSKEENSIVSVINEDIKRHLVARLRKRIKFATSQNKLETVDKISTDFIVRVEIEKFHLTSLYDTSISELFCAELVKQLNELYGFSPKVDDWYFDIEQNHLNFSEFGQSMIEIQITLGMMIHPDDAIDSYNRNDTKKPLFDATQFLYDNGFKQISFKRVPNSNDKVFVFKY